MACRTAMVESMSWKEQMIRCMDFNGEKELRVAMELMCARIVASEAGWKILESSSRVMRSVLDGGAGCCKGGMLVRSIDKGERERFCDREEGEGVDEVADSGGDVDGRFCVWRGEGVLVCVCSVGSTMFAKEAPCGHCTSRCRERTNDDCVGSK